MVDSLIGIDTDVFLWLNSMHNPFWDIFMKIATGRFIWIGLYLSIIYALWRAYGWKGMLVVFCLCCLAVACADQITASLLRPYFERLRPANLDNPISMMVHVVDGYRGGRFGFPSSHAANTFAVATMLSLVFRRSRFTIAIFAWALLNCYSRIYLGLHYPGDLIVGIFIGLFCGLILYFVALLVRAYLVGDDKWGMNDPALSAFILGRKISYRAVDVVIAVELLTVCAIFLCEVSLLF